MKPCKILIVEDHTFYAKGIESILPSLGPFIITGHATQLNAAYNAIIRHQPDIVLLDIAMPVMNGKEALEKMQLKYPNIKVIIMTNYFHDEHIIEFIKAGACSFLPKNCNIDKLSNITCND
jgi:two-component system nitrate/nitrite response regulator NarL